MKNAKTIEQIKAGDISNILTKFRRVFSQPKYNTKAPMHAVIIDRRTSQIIGPKVPIDPNSNPYREVPGSEILWRYLDFWKFKDMLDTNAIFFARGDTFKDDFEGRFSKGNNGAFSATDQAVYSSNNINRSFDVANAQHEGRRQNVFISCWHRNTKENRRMWCNYTSTPNSVVVTTSAKAVYQFMPKEVMKSPVRYHQRDYARTEIYGWNSLFFYKPLDYSYENEFRLILNILDIKALSSDKLTSTGLHLPVNLRKIIHRVITHPEADKALKQQVDTLLGSKLKRLRRENSLFE